LITLLYLDESGCCLESPLSYGYGQIGQQKSITQNKTRGRRINIMGVWEDSQSFEYGLKVGTYKAKNYLQFMDTQGDKAMKRLFDTGKFTVIIQDNASIHRANSVKERIQMWSKQGLMLFFLPPYSPEMNRIEDQWLHLKRQELAGRIFDDEYDLALAIIEGLENRGQQGNFSVERLMFN
jgi:putative transposase